MKAMIFAAGLGTRLRPLTDTMPKALVPVAGVPMLQRVILRLKEAGFREIMINIHHFGEQILEFLQAQENFGLTIRISDERDELLDTGGGVRKARPWLEDGEPFLLHNADVLTNIDLAAFYRHHVESRADATLLTNQRPTSRYLLADADHRLCGWMNQTTGEVLPAGLTYEEGRYVKQAFGCVHVCSPSIFRYMDEHWPNKFSLIPYYIAICRQADIRCYPSSAEGWFDVGKPETLAQADAYYRQL